MKNIRGPNTNREWLEWGRRDPLYGVANWPGKDIRGEHPWTENEFYELGKLDWNDIVKQWRRYGLNEGAFVEIGCGAGRMTKHLSETFEKGHAIDISQHMISFAAARILKKNISWHVASGFEIPVADNSVDAVFSCHVFQHFSSVEFGKMYFREIARVLKPGGSLMIHLPLYLFPSQESRKFAKLCRAIYRRILLPLVSFRTALQRVRMKFGGRPPMHGISYDLNELYHFLSSMRFSRIEFATFPLTSNKALHHFVCATKK